jgi:hypothetical protein
METATTTNNILLRLRRYHESRRLASRRTAAGMTHRRFDVKVENQLLCNFLLHPCRLDLRQTPPRHSNLRFSASPVSRMPLSRHTIIIMMSNRPPLNFCYGGSEIAIERNPVNPVNPV